MDVESISKFTDETVQSLIELGRQTAGPQTVQTLPGNPVPFLINDGVVTALPQLVFNEHSERPERIKASVLVSDPESFIAYWTDYADEESRVFADESKMSVTAVLDYHEASGSAPRWGQHRLTLNLRWSEQWQAWTGQNNKMMQQQQFAEFLEQNAVDITNPASAAIREIAEDLEVTSDVEFASAQKQAGGKVNFKYTEQTKTTVSGGRQITVPDQFTITIPAFVGGMPVPIEALLRYRIKEQKLHFFYTLLRPNEVARNAFQICRSRIAEALQVTIINGQA
jgi:uncharacterized protein YfdQ (DUF2303 family)